MKNERYLNNSELFGKMWSEICAQNSGLENQKDLVRWSMENFQIFDSINDGIAILTPTQEIVWANQQFKNWFPKAADPDVEINVLAAMDGSRFLYDASVQPKYANLFAEFQMTGMSAKCVILTKSGNFFEVAVHPWTMQSCDEKFMLLLVHDATERRELRFKLSNLHQMCDMCSHIDFLKEQKDPKARQNFLIEGIQYMAKSLLHYEFLEVRTYDPIKKTLPLCTHYGLQKEAERRVIRAERVGNGTIGFVAVEKKAYICRDTETDPHYLPGGETARSSLTVPILFQGELFGILNAESSQPDAFKESDQLYAEIFAHEIALTMNFMRALANEQKMGRKTTAEEIHGQIALPVKNIVDLAVKLDQNLRDEQIDAQYVLHQIIKNVEVLDRIIKTVGQQLPMTEEVAPPDRQELVEKWLEEFTGKRILLIDSSEELYRQGRELFECLHCELDWARTGHEALFRMEGEQQNGTPYYALLASFIMEDYQYSTQFFLDLANVYGVKHPPLVILQELNVYDGNHTVTNVRTRYPASGHTGKPFTEPMLLKVIHDTVIKCQNTAPYFADMGENYDDPMRSFYTLKVNQDKEN